MGESFLIALREGFEAALIVAIVLAYVRREAPENGRAVWLGTGAAILLSIVVGVVLHLSIDGLEGVARMRAFAVICIAAAGLLTWMIFWMRTHARSMKGELESRAGDAIATGSAFGLALVAFAAVAREGLETALFLLSTASQAGSGDIIVGTVLGLLVATALGYAVYKGSSVLNMRTFFLITGALVILFAAGLLARAVGFLQASGDVGTMNGAVYDLTMYSWLTTSTQVGRFLAGIFGWDPRPSAEQVIVYLAYVTPVGIAFFATSPPPKRSTPVRPEAKEVALTE